MWEAKWFLIFPYTQPSRIYSDIIATLSWRVTGSLLLLVITSSCLYFAVRIGLRRLLVPTAISVVLLLGALVYNSVSLFDPNHKAASYLLPYAKQLDIPLTIHRLDVVLLNLCKVCVLVLSLLLKTDLGPIITGYVFSAELYSVFVYGKFQPIPILTSILDWVFEGFPFWASLV
jgi:hypothetical protein